MNPRASVMAGSGPVQPETGDFHALLAIFGIPRSTAYELEAEKEIEFIRLKRDGQKNGKVLVDFASVRRFLERCRESSRAANQSQSNNQ